MNSMVIETDMAGNYVGSSYSWATTKVGQFGFVVFAQRYWNGGRFLTKLGKILSKTTNTSQRMGAQFWLNAGGRFPDVP
jgi:surface antigen